MADVAAEVEGDPVALDGVEVLPERLELVHGTPTAKRVEAHVLDVLEGVRHQLDRVSGWIGAIENPQLPAITVVTPWCDDGVRAPSQKTWAS